MNERPAEPPVFRAYGGDDGALLIGGVRVRKTVVAGLATAGGIAFAILLVAKNPDNPADRYSGFTEGDLAAERCRVEARAPVLTASPVACDKAVALDRGRFQTQSDLALISLRRGEATQAVRLWDGVLSFSPTDARALYGRGLARLATDQQDNGRADIAAALAVDANIAQGFASLGLNAPADIPAGAAPRVRPHGRLEAPEGASVVMPDWDPKALRVNLHYPERAVREGVAGKVELACLISKTGYPYNCLIKSEQPQDYGFADAARGVLGNQRVKPATINGKPVDGVGVVIPITFEAKR